MLVILCRRIYTHCRWDWTDLIIELEFNVGAGKTTVSQVAALTHAKDDCGFHRLVINSPRIYCLITYMIELEAGSPQFDILICSRKRRKGAATLASPKY